MIVFCRTNMTELFTEGKIHIHFFFLKIQPGTWKTIHKTISLALLSVVFATKCVWKVRVPPFVPQSPHLHSGINTGGRQELYQVMTYGVRDTIQSCALSLATRPWMSPSKAVSLNFSMCKIGVLFGLISMNSTGKWTQLSVPVRR